MGGYVAGAVVSTALELGLCLWQTVRATGLEIQPFQWMAAPGLSALLAHLIFRAVPLSSPASVYLAEQTEAIAGLDFHRALTLSAVAAWGVWLAFLALTVWVVQKNSGKRRRSVV